jgi:hypothetical protein
MNEEMKQARIMVTVMGIVCLVLFFVNLSLGHKGWMWFDLSGAVILFGLVVFRRWKSS